MVYNEFVIRLLHVPRIVLLANNHFGRERKKKDLFLFTKVLLEPNVMIGNGNVLKGNRIFPHSLKIRNRVVTFAAGLLFFKNLIVINSENNL